MKKLLSYLLNQIIIPNIIWIVLISLPSAIGSIITTIKIINIHFNQGSLPPYLIILSIIFNAICFLVLVADIVICIRRFLLKKKTPIFPKLESDYIIKNAEYELYFIDREHIEQRQHHQIIALRDGVQTFSNTMYWTGQKYVKSWLEEEKGMSLTDSKRENPPYKITIKLPQALQRNGEWDFKLHSLVEDENHCMEPFLSKVVKCQTQHMILRVTAPKNLLKNVSYFISADQAREILLEEPKKLYSKNIGELEMFEIELSNLELLHFYNITWEFKKN